METTYQLSENDLVVLRVAQKHFGFSPTPYREIAKVTGLSEEEVMATMMNLKEKGIITRIGPFLNLDKSNGYVSLVAMIVPEERMSEVSHFVNEFQEVAHNYRRQHEFNMWFVLASKSKDEAMKVLQKIEQQTGLKTFNLPKLKEYNLDLYLEV